MEDYNFIYQFDGNLTDDMGKQTLAVDSGTPSYVTGDHGQALVGNSAALSTSLPVEQFKFQRLLHFVINLRFNTGGTDGNIITIDTGTNTILQLDRFGSSLRMRNWNPNQINSYSADETMTLDTWLCYGFTMWYSTPYRELEPGTTGNNFSTWWSSWTESDFGSDVKFLMGQTGNAVNASNGSTTVATGVDVDFVLFDNGGEGDTYNRPLGAGFDARTAPTFPLTHVEEGPMPVMLSADGVNPYINNTSAVETMQTGGGGPVVPAQKEFWS